jgi:pilus assembly protein CpaB
MNAKVTLVLAILAGLGAAFLVQSHVNNLRGETITVYKSAVELRAGEALGSAGVEEVTIPAGLFPSLLEDAPTSELVDLVQNTPLREPVEKGELLLYRHFDSSVDRGVIPEIPPGKKAISIAVTEESSVAYFIQPGDLVDVLATFMGNKEAAGPQSNAELFDVSTRPIVQAARVLAVGGDYIASERQKRNSYSSVTLLVSMDEAAKLVFAKDYFNVNMTLLLRGENDESVERELPEVGIGTEGFDSIGNSPSSSPAL